MSDPSELPIPSQGNPRKSPTVTKSRGNVFADLGVPQAGMALAKASLTHRLCEAIRARKLNQTQAAEILGLTQPKVSSLMRGQLEGFTLERLLKFLNLFQMEVEIAVQPARKRRKPAETRVVSKGE